MPKRKDPPAGKKASKPKQKRPKKRDETPKTSKRFSWTQQMTEIFIEEAAQRQLFMAQSKRKFDKNKDKWGPLMHDLNARFREEVPGAPQVDFKQVLDKITNTKTAAKKAWNESRYMHKTGAPTDLDGFKGFFDEEVALKHMPSFLKFLDHFWNVPEWTVVHQSGMNATRVMEALCELYMKPHMPAQQYLQNGAHECCCCV